MLVDSFGRRISYLRVSVTDRCNLRCVYCMPAEGMRWLPREEILRFEEIRDIARVAAGLGVTRIRLTGGEPLVREGLTDLVRMLRAVPQLEDLSLTTNGVLLASQAQALVKAGLSRVNISLDTLRPERFPKITLFGTAADVHAGLEAALRAGLNPVKLNVVVMRGVNDDEIVEFGQLTLDRPVHVRFIELMPLGGYFTRERLVPTDEVLARLSALGPLKSTDGPGGCGPARPFKLPKAQGTVGVIGAVTQNFCAQCNRMRLTATGRLRPCLDDARATDLKPALRPTANLAQLAGLFQQAAAVKPEHHAMAEREEDSGRFCMSGIGG